MRQKFEYLYGIADSKKSSRSAWKRNLTRNKRRRDVHHKTASSSKFGELFHLQTMKPTNPSVTVCN